VQAIAQRLPVTIELGVCALLYSLILATPLGIYSATHRNSLADWLANVFSLFSTAIPVFVLGLVLIFFFAVEIRLFPPGGFVSFGDDPAGNIRDLILPMITLGTGVVAVNMRQIRANMVEALEQNYVRTARAKGLSEQRVAYVHALKNASLPVLTIVGIQIGSILAGAFIVETIFLWPGIGQLTIMSVLSKDYPIVQGVVLLSAFSYMAANLLIDICYAFLDPRIRFER
jgi:peptide/nickel transport system permease protein